MIQKMYGHHYSAQTVSNISKLVDKDVKAFHNKPIKDKYTVIYCDCTYISLRRDTVAKESVHTLIGIYIDGKKEILDYRIYPSESKENYREMLLDLKRRGLREVLLFVRDGLKHLKDAVLEEFPKEKHQACWIHISRNIMNKVRAKDKEEVAGDLRNIYKAKNKEESMEAYHYFLEIWRYKNKKVKDLLESHDNLFSFYEFPKEIRRSIYIQITWYKTSIKG